MSIPQLKSSFAFFIVSPKPWLAFSPLAITQSTLYCNLILSKFSLIIFLPGRPTISPMKAIVIFFILSSLCYI